MSIGGIGSSGSIGQNLAALLAALTGSSEASATGSAQAPANSFGACSAPPPPPPPPSDASLTGSTKASLSDEILGLLTQLQQQAGTQSGASSTSTGIAAISAASTTIGTASTSSDPLRQLFSAIDSDGDGAISQTELESYIEKQGGTAAEADALFSGLNQGNSGNLTETTLSNDLQQPGQAQQAGGGHHHHHLPPTADQVGSDLVGAIDNNGSGTVDQSEFENFVTGLGGTTAEADADFTALDPSGTGAVDASQFASAVTNLQTASAAAGSSPSPILTLLDAFKQTASTAGSAVSVTA